jgi:2'-5' RNA ligase
MEYDIATIGYLPEHMESEIDKSRRLISKKFNTRKALDWKPHMTVANRVIIPKNQFEEICKKIQGICEKTKPIKLKTNGFYILDMPNLPFENPYIIGIWVEVNKELQRFHDTIQNEVYKEFKKTSYKGEIYKPHITLAYRDLTKENFEKAREYFSKNPIKADYEFFLTNVQLATPSEKGIWSSIRQFKLND